MAIQLFIRRPRYVFALGLLAAATVPVTAGAVSPVLTGVPSPLYQPVANVDEMQPEMRRAFILGIQEALAKHGYAPGPADGVMGQRTRSAIREYQKDAGLPVNGQASSELLDHIKFTTPQVVRKTPPGPSRALVQQVQAELQIRGYYAGAPDGLDGPATRAAVRHFQQDAGFTVTGAIDERLLQEIRLIPVEVFEAPETLESPEPELPQ